jgi:glutathione S-transferase
MLDNRRQISRNGHKYLVTSEPTIADVQAYYMITTFWDDQTSVQAALEKTPKLKAMVQAVGENSKIKQWESKRPKTQF